MKSLWNSQEAKKFKRDSLSMRVYTSRLLGRDADLVLHGGGNTSVKDRVTDLFGDKEDILFIKGSGGDLATIEKNGFSPVKMDVLLKMAGLTKLSDTDMVKNQRAAMIDPNAPNPSVEAILHAIIPHKYVDHTHADAVVAISNTPDGEKRIRKIYGKKVIIVPYVMPGFILARKVYEMTKNIDWAKYDGMILLHHGVFTFDNDAKKSYEKMIVLVTKAENYLKRNKANIQPKKISFSIECLDIARIRKLVSSLRGLAVFAHYKEDALSLYYSNRKAMASYAQKGPLTPDHVIRTKRIPVILGGEYSKELNKYTKDYQSYFRRHKADGLTCLDNAPRWGVWKNKGVLCFGNSVSETRIISDIVDHTMKSVLNAEALNGWQALPEKDIFDVEYWDLEQAKLKKAGKGPVFQGKVVLITGAASGIGKACVDKFISLGSAVIALDINPQVTKVFSSSVAGFICDLTKVKDVKAAIESGVKKFGGIDIVVSNAGVFSPSRSLENIDPIIWEQSLKVNLTSAQSLIQLSIPYLKCGIDPSIIVVGSKNVPAPGPGAAAYSCAKAALTQLARVAALELGSDGIRVNVIHPNQVFDTAIWTKEVLANRAKHYGLTVEEYKKDNLLKTEILSSDVADLICTLAGPVFSKTTGAQIPIDGGNERVV